MNDFFHDKGTLTVSIGEGYLSAFEAGTLKAGDVVRTTRNAGSPSTLLFNGERLAECEVVIIGDLFGVRIVGLDPRREPDAEPGSRDDLVEMLPVSVGLGSIRVSLAELLGVGAGSFASLGRPFSTEEDANLLVAGLPMARGKVVVIEEEMGLRVTKVEGGALRGATVRASGYLLEPGGPRRVKDYDFKRPDKFSRNAVMRIAEIHGYFLRNLKARLPAAAASRASQKLSVDQCTYGEALEALGDAFGCLVAENVPVHRSAARLEGSRVQAPGKLLLEEEGTARPVSAASRGFIERFAGESGVAARSPVLLYHRTAGSWGGILKDAEGVSAVLSCLRGGWKNAVDLNLHPVPDGEAFLRDLPINQREMVITVTFGGEGKDGAEACLVYPYFTLEPLMGVLG